LCKQGLSARNDFADRLILGDLRHGQRTGQKTGERGEPEGKLLEEAAFRKWRMPFLPEVRGRRGQGMNPTELEQLLQELLSLSAETEWVEFKHNNADPEELGEYLSAISNSAALHSKTKGYIVWGIEDGSHIPLGTTFRPRKHKGAGNEDLEPWLAKLLSPRIDFTIYEFVSTGVPIVIFEVQAANAAPVQFKANRFIRVGSHKKNLKDHP
jgi:Putative DNA-binding domain